MSYDLAVWCGPHPASDEEAEEEYVRRLEEAEDRGAPPTPMILSFLEAVLAYSTIDTWAGSPWAGPLLEDATGDLAVVNMTPEGTQIALEICVRIAAQQGLICFDPQIGRLLTPGPGPASEEQPGIWTG